MLSISLEPEEYVTIGDNIVVKVARMARGRCFLAIEADKSIPIVRSAVREREGTPPPACLTRQSPRKKLPRKPAPETLFRWNDGRERAVRRLQAIADHLEENGAVDEARIMRIQLSQIIPDVWEEEVAKH